MCVFISDYCSDYDGNWPHYDFSHQGSNFPLWHRAFLLMVERELQKIAKDDNFTIPYWDWLNQGRQCKVCTEELVGVSDLNGLFSPLDSSSPFSQWSVLCREDPCQFCNLSSKHKTLMRFLKPAGTFPESSQYDFSFNFTYYDEYPYNIYAKGGFRTALEGFLTDRGFQPADA